MEIRRLMLSKVDKPRNKSKSMLLSRAVLSSRTCCDVGNNPSELCAT